MTLPYSITHYPSGDEAEAETMAAAVVAARTLIQDNEETSSVGFGGFSEIRSSGRKLDTVSRKGDGWLHSRSAKGEAWHA